MTLAVAAGWGMAGALGVLALALISDRRRREVRLARGCHELRGPLTAARLGLGLDVEAAPPALRLRLRAIEAELRRAALIVDDLAGAAERTCTLGLGRAPARGNGGGPPPVAALETVVADVVEARRSAAAAAGVDLEISSLDAVLVAADPRRLAQALGNLVDNATRHAERAVAIAVRARADAVRVEVSDDGPGLDEPLAAVIRRGRRQHGRHGHGLLVAAEVAAACGGRLATAPAARGARFVLELPRVADEAVLPLR